MIQRIENGQPLTVAYSLDSTELQSSESGEIADILAMSGYQQDFRNLLPWDLGYVDADKNYDGRTVILLLSIGSQKEEYAEIQFLSSSIITVFERGETGFRIYHPTNRKTMDALAEYIQTHGAEQ